ncbi:MAG: PQQ-binding-like beta-propeller repeat protein [Planctomycetaceae bacterium]|nr:PQQ-binding-like beta-propeller repeat protein [Planctomycetaceae bacterium]
MSDLRRNLFLIVAVSVVVALPFRKGCAQDQPRQPKDAIGNFLDRLFRGGNADSADTSDEQSTVDEGDSEQDSATNVSLDPFDERTLVDRERQAWYERADRLSIDGDYRQSAQLLQQILDADEDSLLLDRNGEWRSLHQEVERLILLKSDDALARTYEGLVRDRAHALLRQARQQGGFGPLGQVSRRYFATEAGQQAANEIGALMLDAGHIHEAAYWFQRLQKVRAPLTQDPAWRDRTAEVMRQIEEGSEDTSHPCGQVRLSEWMSPFGGPTHTGRFVESDPILIQNWSQPTTERPKLVEQIEQLIEDLQDQRHACIPAAIPLVVDGKVAYRTMRGVSVVDAASGHLLWSTQEDVSNERLLAGETVSRPATEMGVKRVRPVPLYLGQGADDHSLAGAIFRDGVSGFLSSDGVRVFVLEDHATLSYQQPGHYRGRQGNDDPYGRHWESNRIVAYNLDDGRLNWSVGGPQRNDLFDPPLAGVLFQGPPVVDGDELYVIGERRGTETLFVLDRHTGEQLWSHALAGVSTQIDADLVRRWWPALPAVHAGVIVCPTTVGWVLAIDRYEHRIRWTHRYSQRREGQQHSRQATMANQRPINHRWSPSAPMIANGRIVLTPSELPDEIYHTEPQIVCLDLRTGKQRWHRPKEQDLYVAGIFDDRVIVVGTDHLEARGLKDGRQAWQTAIPDDAGSPSGRGIVSGDDFLLPLQSGELWRVSLKDGSIVAKSKLPNADEPLGNLLVDEGRLLSLTPLAITSFASRQVVERTLANSSETSIDGTSQLQAAELLMIDGQFDAALTRLDDLAEDTLSHDDSARRERLLRTSLVVRIRSDLQSSEPYLERLQQLALSPQQMLDVEQLTAARLLALGQPLEAFDVYWRRAQAPNDLMVENETGTVRMDRWLAGQLTSIWKGMSAEERAKVDARVSAVLDSLPEDDSNRSNWWINVLTFHPAHIELAQQLASGADDADRRAETEVRLLRLLSPGTTSTVYNDAKNDLIRLLDRQDRLEDLATLVAKWSGAESPAGSGDDQRPEVDVPLGMQQDWTSERFGISQSGFSSNRHQMELPIERGEGVPSLDGMRLRVHQQLQRLNIDKLNGERFWELPLQFQAQSQFNQLVISDSLGQTVFVVFRGILHAISLADRELLWQCPLDVRSETAGFHRSGISHRRQEMTVAPVFRMTNGLRRRSSTRSMLAIVTPNYVCYFGRNTITALDSMTGEPLWTHEGIGPQTKVVGNSRHVFIVPPSPAAPYALSATDGLPVDLPSLKDLLAGTIAVHEQGLVTIDVLDGGLFGFGKRISTLKLVDEFSNDILWSASFRDETRLIQLSEHEVLAIEPGGIIRLVNWAEQTDRTIGQVSADLVQKAESLYAVADRRRIYVSFNQPSDNHHWTDQVNSIQVNGTLAAFDRSTGRVDWEVELDETNLLTEHLPQLPVLVFHSRRLTPDVPNSQAQMVQLRMLDKASGEQLLDETRYVSTGAFREVDVDLASRSIEFKTYRESLKILPVAGGADAQREIRNPPDEETLTTTPTDQ